VPQATVSREPRVVRPASTLTVTSIGNGSDETRRQAVERELRAAQEEVRRLADRLRERLAAQEEKQRRTRTDNMSPTGEWPEEGGG
jgi:hypothetical protein